MEFNLHFDPGKGLLYARMAGEGRPSAEFANALLEEITHSEEYPPDVPTLWNLTGLDFSEIDRPTLEQFIAVRNRFPDRADARLAFVVADELGFGMTRMYEILAEHLPRSSKVFRSEDEAEQWLLEERI